MEIKTQFIPAQPGWLALFEDATEGGDLEIHAEPVIAWCLGAQELDGETSRRVVSFGQAVIGAGPWVDKADAETASHFFALVREEQLDADFLAEIRQRGHHSREELMQRARANQEELAQGHSSWRHERRAQRATKPAVPPTRIF